MAKRQRPPYRPSRRDPLPQAAALTWKEGQEEISVGRPPLYKPDYDILVERLSLLGLSIDEISSFFGVNNTTVDNWKRDHPSFMAACARGGVIADAEVAESLRKRALGYTHKSEKIFLSREGEIIRAETVEHYPPSESAASLWLMNRQPGRFRPRVAQPEAPGDEESKVAVTGGLPDE